MAPIGNSSYAPWGDPTTTELLARLSAAPRSPYWDRLLGKYSDAVRIVFRSMSVPSDEVDDLVQQSVAVFWSAYVNGQYRRERGRLRSWMIGIARNHALTHHRQACRDGTLIAHAAAKSSAEPDESMLDELCERAFRLAELRKALARVKEEVSPQTFTFFEQTVIRGVPVSEVARASQASPNAVYVAKCRVLQRLERELELSRS